MGISVSVTSNADEVKKAKDEAISAALEAIGLQCSGNAAMLAPVDTGRLRASLTYQTADSEEAVYVGTNVEYAKYQEYGTSKMKAQPFLKPAVMDHIDEYKAIAEQYLKSE